MRIILICGVENCVILSVAKDLQLGCTCLPEILRYAQDDRVEFKVAMEGNDMNKDMVMTLSLKDLKPGQTARIKTITAGAPLYRHKLLSLGLIPGALLTIVRRAPLGCPVEIQVRDTRISLRQHEADILCLEPA